MPATKQQQLYGFGVLLLRLPVLSLLQLLCSAAEPLVTRTSQADDEEPGSSQAATAAAAAPPAAASTLRFTNLPLWRTEWAVLPGCQVRSVTQLTQLLAM
jgi:hypothetical protein